MRDIIEDALGKSDADYAEIRVEDISATSIMFRGADLDAVGPSRSVGGFVRAQIKGGWGYATFNDLTDLGGRVREACESARLVGHETSRLAPVEPVEDEVLVALERDFREVPLKEKLELVEEYNTLCREHDDRIETTTAYYSDRFRDVWFANTEGTCLHQERPDTGVHVMVMARDGDNVQVGSESAAGQAGFETVLGFHEKAQRAARRAVDLLDAPPVRGGKHTVVTNPRLTGVFAHEAFGHLSESDFIYENDRMKELMVLGKRFGPEGLNIIDDGSIPGLRGTRPYDDEGVPTGETYLIREGQLVGRLHSRETAGKMGERPTGNARAVSFRHPPIVRMTNTYIAPGDASFEDMIADVDEGLYALDMIGGQTTMEMFTFSAACGYMIRNGKVAELVRDVVLTGNVFETLQNIDMFGKDLEWPASGGGCGKGGQSPLPVGLGGPHVRIRNCIVGGGQ